MSDMSDDLIGLAREYSRLARRVRGSTDPGAEMVDRLVEAIGCLGDQMLRYYRADGTYHRLGSPDEVVAKRIEAAKDVDSLRAEVAWLKAQLDDAAQERMRLIHATQAERDAGIARAREALDEVAGLRERLKAAEAERDASMTALWQTGRNFLGVDCPESVVTKRAGDAVRAWMDDLGGVPEMRAGRAANIRKAAGLLGLAPATDAPGRDAEGQDTKGGRP